ncbi:MAG: hypothetical protein O2954_16545, partial [bacterium]|nr:hypothetical protein [bacterium]
MELVFGVPIAFLIFLAGTRLYEQRGLSGPLDSLRAGRWHYLIAGFLFNLALRHSDLFPVSLNVLRNSFLEIGLAWFGLQTGLDFDLRRFRSEETRHLLLEAARSGLGFLATFVLVLLIAPYLSTFVGIHRPQGLIALLLASFVTTLRTPELIFHWGQKAFFYTSRLTFPPALCTNPVALILLGILFPFVSENPILNLGFVTTAGTTGIFVVLFGIGLLLGVMLDFIFRAYSEGRTCVYLSIGVLAALSGPCAMLGLPGIVVGFIGGAWLINTTVRRREVLELVEGGTGMIEPFFFLILGGVLAECW